MKRIIKSKKIIILSVLIITAIVGVAWQSIMVSYENNKYPALGEVIDVGTYNMHYNSQGNGDISIVFLAGAGTPFAYTDFYFLQNELSRYGQTITFDHAGLGWSTDTDTPRNMECLIQELSIIIDTAAKDNKIILVCHSLGSLEAIGYAQANPDRVDGIIFLDAGSPEFYCTDSELKSKAINRVFAVGRVLGINRLLGECGLLLPMYGESLRYSKLPENLRKIDKVMYYKYTGSNSNFKNIESINENAAEVITGDKLGDIPILLLSSDSGDDWEQVQAQLAAWSQDSRQITLKNAQHYLHWSNYDDVIHHITGFLETNTQSFCNF